MASKIATDNVQMKVTINGQDAINTIQELDKQAESVTKQLFDLEAAGQKATKQYTDLKSEQKKLLDQSNDVNNQMKAAAKAQEEMNASILDRYSLIKKQMHSVEMQMKTLEDAGEKGSEVYNNLQKRADKLLEKRNELYNQIQKGEAQLERLNDTSGKTLGELETHYRQLMLIIKKLPPEHQHFNQYIEALRTHKSAIDDIKKSFGAVKEEVKAAGDQITNISNTSFTSISQSATDLGDLVTGGLLTGGITAIAGAALEGATAIAEEVAAITHLRGELGLLTGATGEQLDAQTSKVKALSDTFNIEHQELTVAANALAKQTGSSFDEALASIQSGLLAGANANGKFLDQLGEYPTAFQGAFESADQLVGTLTQANKAGVEGEEGFKNYIASVGVAKQSTESMVDTSNNYTIAQQNALAANEGLAAAQLELSRSLQGAGGVWQEFKSKAGEVLYRLLIALVQYWKLLKDGVVAVYENFAPLRIAVGFVADVFRGLYGVLVNLPAVFDGVRAGAQYVGDSIKAFFKDVEIGVAKAKSFLGFGSAEDIARLEAEKEALKPKYRSLGEAVATAYYDGIASASEQAASAGKATVPGTKPKGPGGAAKKDDKAKTKPGASGGEDLPPEFAAELAAFKTKEDKKVEIADEKERRLYELAEQRVELVKKLEEDQLKFDEAAAEKRIALEGAKFDAAKSTTSGLIDLLSTEERARRGNAKAIKTIAIAGIAIDLAKEISGIWRNANSNPINAIIPGFGIAFAGVQTAFAVARAVKQKNQVEAQSYEVGGIVSGPRHAQGGVKMLDSGTGQVVGEMEGGEPYMILSRNTYANNRGIVDALLHSSMYRGGAPVFEGGGVFSTVPTIPAGVSLVGGTQQNQVFGMLLAEQRATRRALEAMPVVLRAEVSLTDFNDKQATLAEIKSASAL